MISFLKDKAAHIFFILFILTISPFITALFVKNKANKLKDELYNPQLSRLNTPEKVLAYCDSLYGNETTGTLDTALYVSILSKTVKERFLHGSLDYSFSDNWIAWLCGKIFWNHMSSIVIPEDILKHPRGLCSQQTIVFMDLMRRKHIEMRSVGLGLPQGPGHFLCEVNYQGKWHLHDVSFEPEWNRLVNHHQSMEYYLQNKDSLFKAYESKMPSDVFNTILQKTEFGQINQMPAKKMRLFHQVSRIFTWIFPVVFFLLFLRAYRRKRSSHGGLNNEHSNNKEKILVNAASE